MMRRLILSGVLLVTAPAVAVHYRDNDSLAPEIRAWYAQVQRSDFGPGASCCGEADAYWADKSRERDGVFYAVITDDRVVPGRNPYPVGTEFAVRDEILDHHFQGNPTGHAVIFISAGGVPICYFLGPGG